MGAVVEVRVSDIIDDIKRYSPAALKVTLSDGTEKAVAVPKSGNRWARTAQVLSALRWTSIECIDAKGALLGVIESEPEDVEDDDVVDDGAADLRGLARVMVDVQRATMRETRMMVDPILRGMSEAMRTMGETLVQQSEAYKTMLQMQQAYLMAPPTEGEDGGGKEFTNMMQMAMALRGMLPATPAKKDG